MEGVSRYINVESHRETVIIRSAQSKAAGKNNAASRRPQDRFIKMEHLSVEELTVSILSGDTSSLICDWNSRQSAGMEALLMAAVARCSGG